MLIVVGYLVCSIILGIGEYREFGELSSTYIITQWVVLGLSIFLNLKFQNARTILGEILAILGGGIALMVILQAILFFVIGDAIGSKMSTTKIVILTIVGILVVYFAFKHFTKESGNR